MRVPLKHVMLWLMEGPRSLLRRDDPNGNQSWYNRGEQLLLFVARARLFQSMSLFYLEGACNEPRILRKFTGAANDRSLLEDASQLERLGQVDLVHVAIPDATRPELERCCASLSAKWLSVCASEVLRQKGNADVQKSATTHVYEMRLSLFGFSQRMRWAGTEAHSMRSEWDEAWGLCERISASAAHVSGFRERYDGPPLTEHVDLNTPDLWTSWRRAVNNAPAVATES